MKCALCGFEIPTNIFSGWKEGNNGQPLVDGRVCDECDEKVIAERIRRVINERQN